ncbi:MAG: hypothetical protein JWM19_944 [Actinomycetia bacterium]|nr:hypothetical protein [Actinomycetes bacterium]
MEVSEENQGSPEAPFGWTLDDKTGQLRPKKSPGRPRVHQVADESDPESHLATRRASVRTNLDNYYARNPGIRKSYQDEWRSKNPGKYSEYNRKSLLKLKREVMDAYGGRCACCGEAELVFLTIDHVDGNGAEHRRAIAAERGSKWLQAGAPTYRWLRDNNFPEGFQVLCANCNCGRHWNGGICPHQIAEHPPGSPDGCSIQVSDLA